MDVEPRLSVVPSVDGPQVAFVCDDRGVILDSSERITDILGAPAQSLNGAPFAALVVRDDEETVGRGLADARAHGSASFSVRLQTRGGEEVEVTISAWCLTVNGARLTMCVAGPGDDARRQAEQRARRLADTQKVIATILELALQDLPLDELLRRSLDLILWIPWLSIEKTGAMFLADEERDVLVMRVQRGLCGVLVSTCAEVSFGSCLCGRAAQTGTTVYAATVDERHGTRYPGIAPHGHYCVPICSGGRTLGVITTYLAPGHDASAIDLEFLMAVADALAAVVMRHRSDARRLHLERQLHEIDQARPTPSGGRRAPRRHGA